MPLGKSLDLSKPPFLQLWDGNNKYPFLMLLWRRNDDKSFNSFVQHLPRGRSSVKGPIIIINNPLCFVNWVTYRWKKLKRWKLVIRLTDLLITGPRIIKRIWKSFFNTVKQAWKRGPPWCTGEDKFQGQVRSPPEFTEMGAAFRATRACLKSQKN